MSTHRFVIDAAAVGMRVDLFLARRFVDGLNPGGLSRAAVQRLIGAGQVTLNGGRVRASARLRLNDLVRVQNLPPRQTALRPEALPLEILFEDKDCLVINKAPGIVVHPAAGRMNGTLVNALLHHCPDLEGIGGERRPGIVHRLDKDTSGAMIVAKNSFAFGRLATQFKDRRVNKEYLALVWGKLSPEKGVIDRPIGRHRFDRKRMSSTHSRAKSRDAVTEWRVEKYFRVRDEGGEMRWVTWMRLKPRTGRTHQIRVHLADLGHPVVGDKVYGFNRRRYSKSASRKAGLDIFPRQVLHADKLGLDHPRTGQALEFHAPLARDIRDLLRNLGDE